MAVKVAEQSYREWCRRFSYYQHTRGTAAHIMPLMEFIQALGVMKKLVVIRRFTLPNKSLGSVFCIVRDHGMVNR